MKLTLNIDIERCGDETCDCCGAEFTDAEILLMEAESDYKQFCFDLGEYAFKQLQKEVNK